MSNKKKALKFSVISAILIFAVYNLIWFINFKSYDKFIDSEYTTSAASSISFRYHEDNVTYNVKKPDYFSLTGNIACSNDGGSIGILMWPDFMCKGMKEYGLIVGDENSENAYLIYVDQDMKYLKDKDTGLSPDKIKKAVSLLERRKNEIEDVHTLMKNEFHL